MDLDLFFARELACYGITILPDRVLKHDSHLCWTQRSGWILSVGVDLYGPRRLEAVAVQIGRMALKQEFWRSGWREDRLIRREWMAAYEWAAERLIPAKLVTRARRMGWESWELAEAAGVTVGLAWVRWRLEEKRMGRIVDFPCYVHLEVQP